jgi:hypothetical protein
MSLFLSTVIENKVLLSVVVIDAALLLVFLLTGVRKTPPAARSYVFASLIIATLLFLFLQDQLREISEPGIEAYNTIHQHYS